MFCCITEICWSTAYTNGTARALSDPPCHDWFWRRRKHQATLWQQGQFIWAQGTIWVIFHLKCLCTGSWLASLCHVLKTPTPRPLPAYWLQCRCRLTLACGWQSIGGGFPLHESTQVPWNAEVDHFHLCRPVSALRPVPTRRSQRQDGSNILLSSDFWIRWLQTVVCCCCDWGRSRGENQWWCRRPCFYVGVNANCRDWWINIINKHLYFSCCLVCLLKPVKLSSFVLGTCIKLLNCNSIADSILSTAPASAPEFERCVILSSRCLRYLQPW